MSGEHVKKKRVIVLKSLDYLPGAEETLGKSVEVIRWYAMNDKDLLEAVQDVQGIITTHIKVTEEIIKNAPLLEVIGTPQAGFDDIDVGAATRAGIPVVANTGAASESVAEFTIALMLALSRRIVKVDRELRKTKNWKIRATYADPQLEMGSDLSGSTIGIIGFGHIGATVARLCRAAFACRILAYDPYATHEQMSASGVEKVDDLLALAQAVKFLLLHASLTKDTRHMINENVLRAMKRDAFLVNCARGPLVDENALIKALNEDWISGAALDVVEKEPIASDSPLLSMPNVIVTPHIAIVTRESAQKRGTEIVKRVLGVFHGEKPAGLVNPEVWQNFIRSLPRRS